MSRLEAIRKSLEMLELHEVLAFVNEQAERMEEVEKTALVTHNMQAERIRTLVNRVKELEYASKHNGELNEFLQKRKLPPKTLGRHVVDVVMDYVVKLEGKRRKDNEKMGKLADNINDLQDKNQRYKQALEDLQEIVESPDNDIDPWITYTISNVIDKALEGDE